MPADRWENTLNWRLSNKLGFKEIDFSLSGLKVFEQHRAPITETEAYEQATVPVPEGYFITNFSLDTTRKLEKAQLNIGFSIYNVLNTDYTDYLNRLRFYAAETGRNFELRINYIFWIEPIRHIVPNSKFYKSIISNRINRNQKWKPKQWVF